MQDVLPGIGWYRQEQWVLLKTVVADPEIIEDTYAEWLKVAEETAALFRAKGTQVVRVDIDILELIEWCRESHRPIDADARASFINFKLQQMLRIVRDDERSTGA